MYFTGETGAGKTLIIDAISIISGDRFSKRDDKKRRRLFLCRN